MQSSAKIIKKLGEALAMADKARTAKSEIKAVGFIPQEVITRSKRFNPHLSFRVHSREKENNPKPIKGLIPKVRNQ